MVGLENTIIKFILLASALSMMVACVPTRDKTLSLGGMDLQQIQSETEDSELIVLLEDDADLKELKLAWTIFAIDTATIGLDSNRLLKLTISDNYDIEDVKTNIGQLKGVKSVQLNFERTPSKDFSNDIIQPQESLPSQPVTDPQSQD